MMSNKSRQEIDAFFVELASKYSEEALYVASLARTSSAIVSAVSAMDKMTGSIVDDVFMKWMILVRRNNMYSKSMDEQIRNCMKEIELFEGGGSVMDKSMEVADAAIKKAMRV